MIIFLKYFFRIIIKLPNYSLIMLIASLLFLFINLSFFAKFFGLLGLLLLIICCYLPTGKFILYYLEHYFPQRENIPNNVKGLILLGGYFSLLEKETKGRPIYNQAAGRIIEFISLAKKHPTLPIVFTGTNTEVILSEKLFKEMGIDMKRVTFEQESQNTYDNSRNTLNLINPGSFDNWVLVTSASHLPRAVGLFEKVGWKILPYPVDFHTKNLSWTEYYGALGHARNTVFWELALIEVAGLFTNFFLGYTHRFLPYKK